MSVSVRKLRYPVCALAASLLLLLLFAFSSRANPTIEIPLPVHLPMPPTVLHPDNFGYVMAIDGDLLVVGAPWSKVEGKEQPGCKVLSKGSTTMIKLP